MKRKPSPIIAALDANPAEAPKPWPETVYVGFTESTDDAFARHVAKHGERPAGMKANLQFVTGIPEPEEALAKAEPSSNIMDVVRGRHKGRGVKP